MDIEDKPPAKLLAFDSTKARGPEPVDLDSPFFKVVHPQYPACTHRDRGVTLDVGTRRAICKCGEVIDNFDALMIYAHAQRRLVETRQVIEEHNRKEAEKKAKRPFVRDVGAFQQRMSQGRRPRFLGYEIKLHPCGHSAYWDKRHPPRRMTCEQCYKDSIQNPEAKLV